MPMDYDSMRTGDDSERTDNVTDYKRTCIDFIEDISGSYLEWVDYYKLPEDEDKKRRSDISAIIEKTNTWIAKVPTSIKAVDVVMNDGIQKMAESTAGKPFQITSRNIFDEINTSSFVISYIIGSFRIITCAHTIIIHRHCHVHFRQFVLKKLI